MYRGLSFALLGLALAGCSKPTPAGPAANAFDPAIADALADPILVDPQLSGTANIDALRPADRPFSTAIPTGVPDATDAAPLTAQLQSAAADKDAQRSAGFAGCDLAVRYGMGWATRLPQGLALPSGAQVIEAAGSNAGACRLRIISVAVTGTAADALGAWRSAAVRAGYAVAFSGGETLLARRARDGAMLSVSAQPRTGGVTVDVMVNRGS